MINIQTVFKNSNSYRQENPITINSTLSPLAKIDDQSRENFLHRNFQGVIITPKME